MNVDIPQPHAARLGLHARTRQHAQDPVTWEETLLPLYQLVELSPNLAETQLRCRARLGFLIAFDAYRHSGGMVQVLRNELRSPLQISSRPER